MGFDPAIIAGIRELDIDRHPLLLSVSLKIGEDQWWRDPSTEARIILHDIVVHREHRGRGLGTIAMRELIDFADEHQLPIVGEMIESGSTPEAVQRLARWYSSLGFTQGDLPVPNWVNGGLIRRAPNTQKSIRADAERDRSAPRAGLPPI